MVTQNNDTTNRMYVQHNAFYAPRNADGTQPANTNSARYDTVFFDNSLGGPNHFLNIHTGDVVFAAPNFVGWAPFTNDGAGVTVTQYENPSPATLGGFRKYIGIGNAGTNHGVLLLNPITRVPLADRTRAITYNSNPGFDAQVRAARVMEAQAFNPTFFSDNARTVGLSNFKIISTVTTEYVTTGQTFSLNGTPGQANTTSYITDNTGMLPTSTSGTFNPLGGGAIVTVAEGLVYPTLVIIGSSGTGGTSLSTWTGFTPNVRYRSLFHNIGEEVIVSNGTDDGLTDFATNITGQDFDIRTLHEINTDLRLLQRTLGLGTDTPETKETTFLSNVVTPIVAGNTTAQLLYEYEHLQHYELDSDTYPTVTSGDVALPRDIRGGETTSIDDGLVLGFTGSMNLPVDGDIVQSLTVNQFDWASINQEWNGTATTVLNLPTSSTNQVIGDDTTNGRTALQHFAGAATFTYDFDIKDDAVHYFYVGDITGSTLNFSNGGNGTVEIRTTSTTLNDGFADAITITGDNIRIEPAPVVEIQDTFVEFNFSNVPVGSNFIIYRDGVSTALLEGQVTAGFIARYYDTSPGTPSGDNNGFSPLPNIAGIYHIGVAGSFHRTEWTTAVVTKNTTVDTDAATIPIEGITVAAPQDQSANIDTNVVLGNKVITVNPNLNTTFDTESRIEFDLQNFRLTDNSTEPQFQRAVAESRGAADRNYLRLVYEQNSSTFLDTHGAIFTTGDVMQFTNQLFVNFADTKYILSDSVDQPGVQFAPGAEHRTDTFGIATGNALNIVTIDRGLNSAHVIAYPRLVVSADAIAAVTADETRAQVQALADTVDLPVSGIRPTNTTIP